MSASDVSSLPSVQQLLGKATDLKSQISAKIKANSDENRYLEGLLKHFERLTPQPHAKPKLAAKKHSKAHSKRSEATTALENEAPNLKSQLAQLAREHGVIAVKRLPELFRAKGWHNGGEPESLKSQASTIVRTNPDTFERTERGYFRLSDNGNANRGLNKRPLIEYGYDALIAAPNRQGSLQSMADHAKKQGYKSHAKSTSLSTLLGGLVRNDSRFIKVSRGNYRLRANA